MKQERIFVGLYSGRAADGVDAAVVAIRYRREKMKPVAVAEGRRPCPPALRRRVRDAAEGASLSAEEMSQLDRDVALEFSAAAEEVIDRAGLARERIAAVGLSGQSVGRVVPDGASRPGTAWTLGAPALVAGRTRLPVVADFAAGDLAAGGLGGPVSAWPDWLLTRDKRLARVLVHLGGIATLTFVPAAAAPGDVLAFDAGPGTIVIDALAEQLFGSAMDTDGAAASGGTGNAALLNELLAEPWFRRPPPKLSAEQDWGRGYVKRLLLMAGKYGCGGEDLAATVTELTARSIADAIGSLTERPHQVVLSGGGARNIHLAGRIRTLLSPSSTITTEKFGLSVRAKQAVCCAILAAARMDGFAAHCPNATGAKRQAVLGSLTGAR